MEYLSEQINTRDGSSYEISLASPDARLLSEAIIRALGDEVDLATVYLERTKGLAVTSNRILAYIADIVADCFLSHENMVICYYCDPFSLLPVAKTNMPVQEYRSRLFQRMFNRYVTLHKIEGVSMVVVEIPGVSEINYVHLIVRNRHLKYVSEISEEIRKDYGK